MSKQDDKEHETEAQAHIKDKLKDMGVMRDDSAAPVDKTIPFWRSKLMVVIVLALGLWALVWWTQKPAHDQQASRQTSQPTTADNWPSPYGYPSPPPSSMTQRLPPAMQDQATQSSAEKSGQDVRTAQNAREAWIAAQRERHMLRDRGAYGPPPGWGSPMHYAPYGYYPAPPPAYYAYGPYYAPPPPYAYPYGWYPNVPPPRTPSDN